MVNKYNAKMGEFGNFLTFTTKDIDNKVSKALLTIDNQVQETTDMLNNVQQQIQTFSTTYELWQTGWHANFFVTENRPYDTL